MKIAKSVTYPFLVLSLVGFILFAVIFVARQMGLQMNPTQPIAVFEEGIDSYVVWEHAGEWWASQSLPFSIFDSERPKGSSGVRLVEELRKKKTPFLFLILKKNMDKEKALQFLEVLTPYQIKKVYVASSFQSTLESLKKVEPRFWYAPSPTTWMKWSVLSTFFLETFYDVSADFLFIDEGVEQLLTPRLRKEIQRRQLPMMLEKALN